MRHAGQAAEEAVGAVAAGTAAPALVRDPKNAHDPNAVAVHLDHGSGPGERFGWIAADEVIDIAEVLDSGGKIGAEWIAVGRRNGEFWARIAVKERP